MGYSDSGGSGGGVSVQSVKGLDGSSRLYGLIPAAEFGVKADGVTDDTNSLKAAVNYAASLPNGGTIVLPTGKIKTTTGIIWKNKVSMIGQGVGKTIFTPVGSQFAVIYYDTAWASASSPYENCHFKDFEVDGSGFTDSSYYIGTKAFYMQFLHRCSFRNLYIHDTPASGLGVDYLENCFIDQVDVYNCGRLWTYGGGGGAGIGIGIGAWAIERLTISNCHADACGNYGIFVEFQAGQPYHPKGIKIVNCTATNGRNVGISDKGATGLITSNCQMIGNANAGFSVEEANVTEGLIENCIITDSSAGEGIYFRSSPSKARYSIKGNRIARNYGRGLRVDTYTAMEGLTLSKNEIHDNGLKGIEFVSNGGSLTELDVSQNSIFNNGTRATSGSQQGFFTGVSITRFKISNNRIWDNQSTKTQSRALETSSAATLTTGVIENNDVRGNIDASSATVFNLVGTVASDVVIRCNKGRTLGVSAITVGASPFTYTSGNTPETVYVSGGTVSGITKSGVTIATASGIPVQLDPNESIIVTYSVAPTMAADKH